MRRPARINAIWPSCAFLVAAACANTEPDPDAGRWVRVLQDANYIVAIDTVRVSRFWDRSWQVWYRTDHAIPRLHKGKQFNREIVNSRVNCDSLVFKVVSVDMSMNGGPPISLQRMDHKEMDDQPWRRVELGTVEEIAAQAACHFAARRIRAASKRGIGVR